MDAQLSRDLGWVLWRLEQPDLDEADREWLLAARAMLERDVPDGNE